MTSDAEWAEFERLKGFLKSYDLADILSATSEQVFQSAHKLKELGYQDSGAELERFADILGGLYIPGIPTAQNQ